MNKKVSNNDKSRTQNKSMNLTKSIDTTIMYDFNITVFIKNKSFIVHCGDGKQKIRWLIDVVLHKFDRHFAITTGKY